MPGPSTRPPSRVRVAGDILETPQTTLLDVFDELLNRGVMATGELMLGVAGVDLIYLRLSALLCAADRVLPKQSARLRPRGRRSRNRLRQAHPSKLSAHVESSRSAKRRKS